MNRARLSLGALFFVMLLLATACFQEIERPSSEAPVGAVNEPSPSQTTAPILTPTLAPTETPLPSPTSAPTATFVPTSTATMIALETVESTATATAEALPTDTPIPTPTSAPEPTSTATPLPRPTATFVPVSTPTDVLFLEILGPVDGQRVQDDRILVYGFTSPGASVDINENKLTADSIGQFQRIIRLSEGANLLDIVARNGRGDQEKRALTVTRLPLQPFILIVTTPENLSVVNRSPIQLIGVTSSQAIVSVNGITIDVGLGGIFETNIVLKSGELNNIDVIATNIDGDVKSTRISVFYEPKEG